MLYIVDYSLALRQLRLWPASVETYCHLTELFVVRKRIWSHWVCLQVWCLHWLRPLLATS